MPALSSRVELVVYCAVGTHLSLMTYRVALAGFHCQPEESHLPSLDIRQCNTRASFQRLHLLLGLYADAHNGRHIPVAILAITLMRDIGALDSIVIFWRCLCCLVELQAGEKIGRPFS